MCPRDIFEGLSGEKAFFLGGENFGVVLSAGNLPNSEGCQNLGFQEREVISWRDNRFTFTVQIPSNAGYELWRYFSIHETFRKVNYKILYPIIGARANIRKKFPVWQN
jgi:hypothetical protein